MHKKSATNHYGFTLIEMIVSLGVFSVVVTTAVGAMLILISTNQQLQSEQSVMTNLAFALDTMTREIRTGYNYYCEQQSDNSGNNNIFSAGNNHESLVGTRVQNCPYGRSPSAHDLQGISFYEGGDSITSNAAASAVRIMYYFDGSDPDNKTIMRRVGNDAPQSIVSSGLEIVNAEFVVTGSENLEDADDSEQPTVTIYIEARDRNNPTSKTYYLQTTVTQRTLDL